MILKPNNSPSLALLLGLGLTGCFFKPGGNKPEANQPGKEFDSSFVKTSNRAADSAATWNAQLIRMDTMLVSDSAAAALYQLTLENYLVLDPKDPKADEVKLLLGNHLFALDRYDSALALFKGILGGNAVGGIRTEASQMVAQAFIRMGDADKAQEWFQQNLQDRDSSTRKDARDRLAQALYLQGEVAEKQKRFADAAKYYGDVTRAFPTSEISPIALYNCGVLREKLKEWQRALAAYTKFTELYYDNAMLPRVLFRQAKAKEMLGDWAGAAEGYLKLARTYPSSEQAEPSQYNAGFAFANAKLQEKAAVAFEGYADRFPQGAESPNLLFKAVEMRAELKQWDKVSEMQILFERRYGSDRNRSIQAKCLGGLAAYHQGKTEEARKRLANAVESFRSLGKGGDAQARIYAAQAQFTLAEISARDMASQVLRENAWDADLDQKTAKLKSAVNEYLKVVDYRIAEWAFRAAYALGQLFEDYGLALFQAPWPSGKTPEKNVERAIQNLETMGAAWVEAADHYAQAQDIAGKQNVHDRFTEAARLKPYYLHLKYAGAADSFWDRIPALWPVPGLPAERPVREAMQRLAYMAALASQAVQVGDGFLKRGNVPGPGQPSGTPPDSQRAYPADSIKPVAVSTAQDSSLWAADLPLKWLADLGRSYRNLSDTVRSAPAPKDSLEAFFFKVKLVREGLLPMEVQAIQAYEAGIQVAKAGNREESPWMDSLRIGLGRTLYQQGRSYALLARRALANPPIPHDAPAATRRTFESKFEEIGYKLQEEAAATYKAMVTRAKSGQIDTLFAELALAHLFMADPATWSKASDTGSDSILPVKPWDGQSLTSERLAFLKALEFPIPHLLP